MKRDMEAQGARSPRGEADDADPYADDSHPPFRAIAQSSKKAADEADVLATEPRAMRPHGVMQ